MDGWVDGWVDGCGQRCGAGSRRTNQEVTLVQEKRDDEGLGGAARGMDRLSAFACPCESSRTCTHHLFPSQVTVSASVVESLAPSSNADLPNLRRLQGPRN